jgi:hypothetical protein
MALDTRVAPHAPQQDCGRPVIASLRWGLGWTIVVATLGATAGCVSESRVEAPGDVDDSTRDYSRRDYSRRDYSSCLDELGGMPDAADHHIDACQALAAATAAT